MLKVVEDLKVRNMLMRIISEHESSQKGRKTVSVNDVFSLLDKRYNRVQIELENLKEKFSNDILVTNMYFYKGNGEEIAIVIEYLDDNYINQLIITQDSVDEIEICHGDEKSYHDGKKLLEANRKSIATTFKALFQLGIGQGLIIPTTSKLFRVTSNIEAKSLSDFQNKWLSIVIPYQNFDLRVVTSPIPQINQSIQGNNLPIFLDKFQVYEDDLPKFLKNLEKNKNI